MKDTISCPYVRAAQHSRISQNLLDNLFLQSIDFLFQLFDLGFNSTPLLFSSSFSKPFAEGLQLLNLVFPGKTTAGDLVV